MDYNQEMIESYERKYLSPQEFKESNNVIKEMLRRKQTEGGFYEESSETRIS